VPDAAKKASLLEALYRGRKESEFSSCDDDMFIMIDGGHTDSSVCVMLDCPWFKS